MLSIKDLSNCVILPSTGTMLLRICYPSLAASVELGLTSIVTSTSAGRSTVSLTVSITLYIVSGSARLGVPVNSMVIVTMSS